MFVLYKAIHDGDVAAYEKIEILLITILYGFIGKSLIMLFETFDYRKFDSNLGYIW